MSRWPVPDGPPDFTSGNAALREQFPLVPQGISADLIATIEGFSRDDVDAFAVRSQDLAAKAMAQGAFDNWLKSRNEAGLFAFRYACPPVSGVHIFGDRGTCAIFNREMNALIEAQPELRNVALVSIWREALEGAITESPGIKRDAEESLRLFSVHFAQTVERYSRLGRKVYLWEPVPGARGNVPLKLARALLNHEDPGIEISLPDYLAANAFFFEALARNKQWIHASFSPSRKLCGSGTCAVIWNGKPLYSDSNHISHSTAEFWIDVLAAGASESPALK